jgi:Big-like domain-containing protein/putative Ig domain-containing protein/VCBS repeat protein
MLGVTADRVLRALTVAGALLSFPLTAAAQYVIGPGPGGTAPIQLIEPGGTRTLVAFPGFLGGVSVTLGDVNGDGVADVIAGAGPGGAPHVKVFNGTDLSELASFFAFDPGFTGGVHVAAGDIDGDGRADIIVGAGPGGGPQVRVLSGANLSELASFWAYDPAFDAGVTVAAGDVNGDGRADIVTGAGPGGGPHVRVLSGLDLSELASFFAYDPSFQGGVNVAAGDLDGDGLSDIVTAAGRGGGPHVRVFNAVDLSELASFFAFDPAFGGGVSVATGDIDGDGRVDLILGALDPHVRILSGVDLSELASFFTPPGFGAGISVGSVGDPPGVRFTSPATTAFTVGSPGTFTVTTQGGPVPALTLSGTLPAGVTFTDNGDRTATLAGTPAAGSGGSYALTFTADNGIGTPRTQTFTLTVNQAPAIISAAVATFPVGAPATFAVTTTGFPVPTIARGGAALPAGITWVDNGDGTGTLSGTAGAGTGGTYALTFTASNGVGAPVVQTFTLTVNGAPAITSANTTTFTVGTPGTFTVSAIGSPTPALTVGGSLPAGVTFVDNGTGTGTLSGTPAGGTGGAYAITFSAANGLLPNGTQAFTLNVNQAPAITSAASTTFTVGTLGSFTVTTSGFPASTIARGGVALPSGLTFVDNGNGTGTLSGTAAAGTGGTYAISFTATNAAGTTAPQPFTLTIAGPPAITSANTATFTLNTPGTTFQVVMTGVPAPTVSVTAGVLPTGLTLSTAGLLSGTATQSGSFPVTLTATNGTLPNATQAFTVIVNAPPAITSANATTFTVGSAGSFTVVMTGFPAPTVSVTAGTLPAGVTLSPAGVLSGTPDPGTGGVHNVTFTATNGIGANAVQAFTLTVNQSPAITSAASTAFTVGVAGSFTVTTTGFPTPGITRTGVALPGGVTFTDNGDGTGTLSGTPAAGTAGSYAITFTAANGALPNAVQAFTLTVQQAPAITSANSTTFTVGTPGTFTVTTTGFPVPTVSQTGTLPTGVTFTPATKVLAGTATQTGAFPLVFTATNAVPPDATQNFTLNVVCPAITVTPLVMPDGLYQTVYAGVDFNQTGSTGTTFTWGATGLPAGLTIDVNTGVVSGTATNTVLAGGVAVTVTDNFGCQGTLNTAVTIRPTTDPENYIGGVGNTQYVTGAPFPLTPHVAFVDNVKTGDNGPGALSVTFPATSTNGGTIVEGTADGTFIYTPAVAFAGPTDTFTYTLTDGNGVTNTGTVTINLSNVVWYVNSAGGAGDGRSHNPFNTLSAPATPSGSTHIIYVHSGGATTTGNLAMDANQTLHGQGAAFTLNGLTIGAGTRPTLTGTVTLADNTTLRAVNFTPSGIPAMAASGVSFAQPVTIDQVNVTGGTSALSLTNVTATATGAINVSNASFLNTSAAEVLISQGNIPVTLAATATISSNAGRSIDIQSRTGGTVTFNGAITDTGTGILLNGNGTSTFSFSGGMTLNGTGTTFTATNPSLTGTLTITGTNTIGATTPPTSGTALNVTNVNIGASGLTFRTISASGGTKGIILNTTGSGAFTVSGTGPAGTGGTIQNATSRGAEFISVNSVTLNDMNFTNNGIGGTVGSCGDALGATITGTFVTGASCVSNVHLQTVTTVVLDGVVANDSDGHGLNGYQVGTLTLTGVTVERNGNEVGEDGVQLVNSGGTVTVNGTSTFRDNASNQFEAQNGSGTATFNVSGAFFGLTNFPTSGAAEAPSPGSGTANSGLLISASGTANMTTNVTGSTFDENYANGYLSDTAGAATMNITLGTALSGNTFTNNGVPIEIVNAASGALTYVIRNNTITNATAITGIFATTAITGARSGAGSVMSGTIDDNTIGTPGTADSGCFVSGCDGISLPDSATSNTNVYHVTVTNNQINHVHGGITSNIGGISGGQPRTSFVVTGNLIQNPTAATQANGFLINSGTLPDNVPQTCAEVSGNTFNGAWSALNGDSLRFRHRGAAGSTFRVRNWDGTGGATPGLENFLETTNTFGPGTVDGFGFQLIGANVFTGGAGACPQ